jgi:hypothetical protein
MTKVHFMPSRTSDAETSFRNLDAEEAAQDSLPEHRRSAPQPVRGSETRSIEEALRRAAAQTQTTEGTSRPAHERVSEVRLSAPSTIEEAVLRAVEELDAFLPVDALPRRIPKA